MDIIVDKGKNKIEKTVDLFHCMDTINKGFCALLGEKEIDKKKVIDSIRRNLKNLVDAIKKYYKVEKFEKSKDKSNSITISEILDDSNILSSEDNDQSDVLPIKSETQILIDQLSEYLEQIREKLHNISCNKDINKDIYDAMALFNSIFSPNMSNSSDYQEAWKLRNAMNRFAEQKAEKEKLRNNPPKEMAPFVDYLPTILQMSGYVPLDSIPVEKILNVFGTIHLLDDEKRKAIMFITNVLNKLKNEKSVIGNTTEALNKLLQDETIKAVITAAMETADETKYNKYLIAIQHCLFIEFLEQLKEHQKISLSRIEEKNKKKNAVDYYAPIGLTISYDEHKTKEAEAQLKKIFDNKLIYTAVCTKLEKESFDNLHKLLIDLEINYGRYKTKRITNILHEIETRRIKNEKDSKIGDLELTLKNILDNQPYVEDADDPEDSMVNVKSQNDDKKENPGKSQSDWSFFTTIASYINPMSYFGNNKKESASKPVGNNNNDDSEDNFITPDCSSDTEPDDENNNEFSIKIEQPSDNNPGVKLNPSLINNMRNYIKKITSAINALESSIEKVINTNKQIETDLGNNYNEQLLKKVSLLIQKRGQEIRDLQAEKKELSWFSFIEHRKKRYEIDCKTEIFTNTALLLNVPWQNLPALIDEKFESMKKLKRQENAFNYFNIFSNPDYQVKAEEENLNLMVEMLNYTKINTYAGPYYNEAKMAISSNKYTIEGDLIGQGIYTQEKGERNIENKKNIEILFNIDKQDFDEELKNKKKYGESSLLSKDKKENIKQSLIFNKAKEIFNQSRADLKYIFSPLERKTLEETL